MAILAVGLTAVIGLFTLATATHKRAIDQTTAALVAETVMADVRGSLTLGFDVAALPLLSAVDPQAGGAPTTRVLKRDGSLTGYPGYAFDAYLTPVGTADAARADTFLLEVHVRWKASGRDRGATYQTVVSRRVAVRDLGGGP